MRKAYPRLLLILFLLIAAEPAGAGPDAASAQDTIRTPPRKLTWNPSAGEELKARKGGRSTFRITTDETSAEVVLFRMVNGRGSNSFFDSLMPAITDFRKWRFVLLAAWLALLVFGGAKGRWAAVLMIPLIAASDQVCASLIKPAVRRLRPCEVLGSVHFWHGLQGWITTPPEIVTSYKSSFSFPSNHAANITAAMVFLGFTYRRWLWPMALVAIAVSYSRIYIGVHWPLDVAAGMLIGLVLALAALAAHEKVFRNRIPVEHGSAGRKL